ncbi:MAG: type IV pilus modification PilV family protein [Acidimicrobiales bacterium]
MGGVPGRTRSRGTRRSAARSGHPESGLAFIEVVIASVVLLISVVAVGSQLGTQFLSISTSSQQQAAAGLLNQAMEEVRALPYTFVANGLSVTDATVTGDPNILVSGQNCTTNNTAIWSTAETIPCAAPAGQTQAPFVPHTSYPVVDSTTFSVAAYPSIDAADSSSGQNVYRVTVTVSWHASHPGLKQLVAQTLVYSAASGCITQTNHPFAAPCQPFLYSGTSAGGGFVNVTPEASSGNPAVGGIDLSSIELLLALSSSEAEIEQVSTVLGEAQTSGGSIIADDSSDTGKSTASVSADNDPGTARGTSAPASVSNNGPAAIEASASGADANWISVVPGSGDSGSTMATANASASPPCDDLAGNMQLTGLPCGSSSVSQLGSAASLLMGLYAGTSSLGTSPLASVSAQPSPYPNETFASRYTSSGGTYCATTSGDGCVHAGAQESLGTVELAGLPAQFVTDGAVPTAWGTGSSPCPAGNYLLAVVNFSAGASSESGINAASPSTTVPLSGAPTPYLCYWTATGYVAQAITWGANAPSVTFPSVSVTDTQIASGAVTVSITPTLQLQGTSTTVSTPSGCASVCTANTAVPSPVAGDIVYVVSQGGTTIADLDVHVNLGGIEANTSYQAAP